MVAPPVRPATFIFPRIRIDVAMKNLVDEYNQKIHTAMKDAGITYVPFQLEYISYNAKTNMQSPLWKGNPKQRMKKAIKTVKFDLDQDFLKSYFSRKISFEQWLSKNHNTVAREHYRFKDEQQPNDHYQIKDYFKKFQEEVPVEDQKPTLHKRTPHVAAYIEESSQNKEHRWTGASGADIDNFIENEDYLFSNNMRIFLQNEDSEGIVKGILKDVLSEFREAFMNLDLSEIAYEDVENDPTPTFRKNDPMGGKTVAKEQAKYQPNKKWLETLTGEKQTWNQTAPKFPNVSNVLDWFKRKGLYKSIKSEEFYNIKTVKGRMNWIDRSVFLLANGVYAKALGQSTTFANGKAIQSAGAKIPISKARKYNKPSKDRKKYQTDRQLKLAALRIDMRKFAAGWRNRSTSYSRVNRKRGNTKKGNTSRYDKRKDNRGAV
tara:strand:+ start:308 stop:1606 length:1299 start_codon:yes stop_codon:yes gene_type:complete